MPRKKSSEPATSPTSASTTASEKRNKQQEETAVLAWLAVEANRNIVTGAAGSAQNKGGLAGNSVVVSKDAGWSSLAKHLSEACGIHFDKKQAANKFTYLEAKFRKAKIWHNTSGVGIDDEDRKRGALSSCILYFLLFISGIHDVPAKLNWMCPSYDLWNSWFGNWQKYEPASIIVSAVGDDGVECSEGECAAAVEGDDADEHNEVVDRREDAVDSQTGGADGVGLAADEEQSSMLSSPTVMSPVAAGVSPVPAVGGGRKRPPATPASTAVATLAQSRAALAQTVAKPPIMSSPSVSSSGSGSSKNFDVIYARAQENKMFCLRDIERSKCDAARSHQSAEHAFQIQHAQDVEALKTESALKQQRREHEFQARRDALVAAGSAQERVVRQKIEFEKNVASLLVADSSGKLADVYLQKCNSRVSDPDPVAGMLANFLHSYAPSNV
jgi:hypothetical protein